jgi:antibiotic biosynthesis monooxygenase (ABM) superfamily enzyme
MTWPHRQPPAARSARRRLAIVTWLGAYPTLTALLALSQALGLTRAPLPLRTLAVTLILVPLMVFVLQPNLIRIATRLRRSRTPGAASRARGRGKQHA